MNSKDQRFDTGSLDFLRHMLERIPMLKVSAGEIPRFRIVIDANEVVSALLYRLQHPQRGRPLLDELIHATLLEVHAPRWLEVELRSVIPKVAAEMGLAAAALWKEFEDYRPKFHWDEAICSAGADGSCDPKDEPYVVLAEKVGAVGIYSNDSHISKLGGHRLDRGFIIASRDYARSAAKSIGSRVSGLMIPTSAFMVAIGIVVAVVKGIARLPPGLRLAVLGGVALAIAVPQSRRWLADKGDLLWSLIQDATPQLFKIMGELTALANAESATTQAALASVTRLTRRPCRKPLPTVAGRRAPRRPVTAPRAIRTQ
jgi:hypothetical protein